MFGIFGYGLTDDLLRDGLSGQPEVGDIKSMSHDELIDEWNRVAKLRQADMADLLARYIDLSPKPKTDVMPKSKPTPDPQVIHDLDACGALMQAPLSFVVTSDDHEWQFEWDSCAGQYICDGVALEVYHKGQKIIGGRPQIVEDSSE